MNKNNQKGSVLIMAIGVLTILSLMLATYVKLFQDEDNTNQGLFLAYKKMLMTEGTMEAYLGAVDYLGTDATDPTKDPNRFNPFVKPQNTSDARRYDDVLETGFSKAGHIHNPLHGGSWENGDFDAFGKIYNQGCWQTIFLNYRISQPQMTLAVEEKFDNITASEYYQDFYNMAVGIHHPHVKPSSSNTINSLNSPVASPTDYYCPTGCAENPLVTAVLDSTGTEVPIYIFNYYWTNIDYTGYRRGEDAISSPAPALGNTIEFNSAVMKEYKSATLDIYGALAQLYDNFPRIIKESHVYDLGATSASVNKTWYFPDYACDLRCWEDSVPWGKKKNLYDENEHAWPKFRRDSRNTGVAPVKPILNPTVEQIGSVGSNIGYVGPVIGGIPKKEVVYAASGHKLVAFVPAHSSAGNTPGTVETLWSRTFVGGFEGTPLVGPNDTILVGTECWIAGGSPELALLDAKTGNYIWKVASGQGGMNYDTGLLGSPVMDKGIGMMELSGEMRISIYVESYMANVYSVDFLTGTKNWFMRTGNSDVGSPCLSADDGTMYFPTKYNTATNGVYAVDPSGSQKWFYCTVVNVQASPTISENGTIYQFACDGFVHSLNPDGSLRWKVKVCNGSYCSGTMASPAYWNGKLYVRTFSEIVILDDSNGNIIKNATFPNPSKSMRWYDCPSPCIASDGTGMMYVCDNGGSVHAMDLDGNIVWSRQVSPTAGFLGSPALGWDGTVYVTDYSGNVFQVYDPSNRVDK